MKSLLVMKLIMVFGESTLVNPYPPPSHPPHLILVIR